ncbi:adenylate/guanylate cyclase domain-containing protein [Winogradskyella endarachnes]|uniref:Guanylate cyclase domain-containing protein n=1 Tax=Winogradskyella endarachnes TaxID=2681965 RepID=A0A6L6U8L6_9FLAO|nr:adenylate/guanylate cyclase domain-containing protein [Winogradskyella endarachnes]MUU78645.1 hypothetical protein [Winogradskyella endarachnes]
MSVSRKIDKRVRPVFIKQGIILSFFWGLFGMLYIYIRYIGQTSEIRDTFPYVLPLNSSGLLLVGFSTGFLIGLFLALINVYSGHYLSKLSVWQGIIFNLAMVFVVSLFCIGSILLIALLLKGFEFTTVWSITISVILSHHLLSIFAFMLPLGALFNLAREISLRLGPNHFWKILSGSYRKPIEENRVFLFVDLASSTSIAEHLSHIRYSELIQDCFEELSLIALEFNGSIYQFVGDEAVITWSLEKDQKARNKAVKLFFAFRKALENNTCYFSEKYNVQPVFRGAVHSGMVTIAEIGVFKKEIAYHGDVLNTTARLMQISKENNNKLAMTTIVMNGLPECSKSEFLGEYVLRGKNSKVTVYLLKESSEAAPQ